MRLKSPSCLWLLPTCALLIISAACNKATRQTVDDHPRLTANVTSHDVTFHSSALNRDMVYRAIVPVASPSSAKLPVVYLLHGGGGNYRDWSNDSDVSRFAEEGMILIMPEGNSSYYTNSATQPAERYEDYIVQDLIQDVARRFPEAASNRESRAIAGVSMGGYGALKIALRHPELFAFAAGLSPAVDVPSRPFSIKRIQQWRFHSSIFGPSGSATRKDNDPFVLARIVDPDRTPFLYFVCGDQEGLLPPNRALAVLLTERHFEFEFHTVPGGHDWTQWNKSTPDMFRSLREHL